MTLNPALQHPVTPLTRPKSSTMWIATFSGGIAAITAVAAMLMLALGR